LEGAQRARRSCVEASGRCGARAGSRHVSRYSPGTSVTSSRM
jgi:hypothetical protein